MKKAVKSGGRAIENVIKFVFDNIIIIGILIVAYWFFFVREMKVVVEHEAVYDETRKNGIEGDVNGVGDGDDVGVGEDVIDDEVKTPRINMNDRLPWERNRRRGYMINALKNDIAKISAMSVERANRIKEVRNAGGRDAYLASQRARLHRAKTEPIN